MKPLSLTEKQRSELLEMCNMLFHSYSEIAWSTDFERFEGTIQDDNPNLLLFFQGPGEIAIEIHWFEFCIKQLIPKITEGIENTMDIRILFCSLPNPIDYLYDKFKQIS